MSLLLKRSSRLVLAAAAATISTLTIVAPGYADDRIETALVGPGTVAVAGMGEVSGILVDADIALYREIFQLQESGEWEQAKARVARLSDTRLVGHILAQRYLHPTKYRSRFKELRAWLADYADHPQARRIHKLAVRRMPAGTKSPTRPVVHGLPSVPSTTAPQFDPPQRSRAERRRAASIKSEIVSRVHRGWPTGAREVLERQTSQQLLSEAETAGALRDIARAYFRAGKDREALAAADRVIPAVSDAAPLAHWWGGLAAWRLGQMTDAQRHFSALAESRTASGWNVAAGAYWASRAYLVDRQPAEVNRLLAIGAGHPYTFYGLLSRRALALDLDYDWALPALDRSHFADILDTPQGSRAIALLQVGRTTEAEAELLGLAGAKHDLVPAIMALASRTDMPALSHNLSRRVPAGVATPAAMFPLPHWQPEGGFDLDRALVFAFMRQESAFNTRAKSRVGARGLMQLMPQTASFIGRQRSLRSSHKHRLFEPEFNMALGQRYLGYLLQDDGNVAGDLFRLAAAYNGGPGNLAAWMRKVPFNDDPLLFIESVPLRETRIFVERVLTNFWIYRDRMGQDTPSLDAVVAGQWPGYAPLDGDGFTSAQSIAY